MSEYLTKRTIIGTLERGGDLYSGIVRVAQENHVRAGRVTGIGDVHQARLAYYDQKLMKYHEIELCEPMEIVSLYGNICEKDGQPFVHAHVVLSDEKGNGQGGHLLPGGTPVIACEITLEEFDGHDLVHRLDPQS